MGVQIIVALKEVFLGMINNLPAILTAAGTLVTLLYARKSSKQATSANEGVQLASANAEQAAVHADEAHNVVQEIRSQNEVIAKQTNGHLSRLTDEVKRLTTQNEALQKTVMTLSGIITAERTVHAAVNGASVVPAVAVRSDDIDAAVNVLQEIKKTNGDPVAKRRKKDDDGV